MSTHSSRSRLWCWLGLWLGLPLFVLADPSPSDAETLFTPLPWDVQFVNFGASFAVGDFDNDGWQDILRSGQQETAGSIVPSFAPLSLMHNEIGEVFPDRTDLLRAESLPVRYMGNGQVFGHYDNDGDLDL